MLERADNGAFCLIQAFLIRACCTQAQAGHEDRTDRQPNRHSQLTTKHTDTLDGPLQPGRRSAALHLTYPHRSITSQGERDVELQRSLDVPSLVSRGRDALTACATRRESIPGGSVAASMPPHGPAGGKGIAPANLVEC
ncbi:hypothetical protein FFY45_18955 [Xanthomonas hortorum]|nr:hypothetical protein [Xanthomonas hortorum]